MSSIDERIERLWTKLESLAERLPVDETAGGGRSWCPGNEADEEFDEEELEEREQYLAEDYLQGRRLFQVSRRLRRYVEQQELGKVRDAWGELTADVSVIEEPLPLALRERGESIMDELEALALRREMVSAKKSDPRDNLSDVTLELVDPLLLEVLAKHPNLLTTLDWRVFEKLLARILEDLGYEIELQRGSKDGGIDIFALRKDSVFGAHRYLLQAKRWTNAVGVEPVRELLFLHNHHRITRSCLATTSRFTNGAWELARDYAWQLELRDFDKLQEWINMSRAKYGRKPA